MVKLSATPSFSIHAPSKNFSHSCLAFSFAWGRYRRRLMQFSFARHLRDNLPPVEAPIFDENVAGVFAADDDTRHIYALHVSFERIGIHLRPQRFGVELDSLLPQKIEIWMVARHRENVRGGNRLFAIAILYPYLIRLDARHLRVEHRFNLAGGDTIRNIRLDPEFQALAQFGTAMNQRDVRPAAEQVRSEERRVGKEWRGRWSTYR